MRILSLLLLLLPFSAAFNVSTLTGEWQEAIVDPDADLLVPRHEACAVMVKGKVVLLGGRGQFKPVNIFDPATGVWERKKGPGIEMHHMQCVAVKELVYIISSWRGGFPEEKNNEFVYIYNVTSDEWTQKDGLPEPRLRGGGAAVKYRGRIYLLAGNRGGHGGHATTLGWVDAYIIKKDRWITNLPSMPAGEGRDHVGGALVGDEICIGGGRDGGKWNFWYQNKATTWCFHPKNKTWRQADDFPEPRAGAMTGTTCDGRMMIAGGEGNGQAYRRVDSFNGTSWTRVADMVLPRHGSGLAVSRCKCGHIFIPSGSGWQGGSPELKHTEQFVPAGANPECRRY